MMNTTDTAFVTELTEFLSEVIHETLDDVEGTCLGASAILAAVLDEHGILTWAIHGAIHGACMDEPHWWLATTNLRLDPTRGQFDDGPLVTSLSDDHHPYRAEDSRPALWTMDQARSEVVRMFRDKFEGSWCADEWLTRLSDKASELRTLVAS
jgi:hypothetical protein